MKNCPNCGAPIEPYKIHCEYCNTYYFDLSAFDCTKKCFVSFYTDVGWNKCKVTALAIPKLETVEMNTDTNYICDRRGAALKLMTARKTCDLRATFSCVENPEDKSLFKVEILDEHT